MNADDYAALTAYTAQFRGDDYSDVEVGEVYFMTQELHEFMTSRYDMVQTDEHGFVRVTSLFNDDIVWVKGEYDVFESLVPKVLLRYRVTNVIPRDLN